MQALDTLDTLLLGIQSNLLLLFNFPPNDPLSVVAKVCFLINILGSFIIESVSNFNVIEKSDWYNKGFCYSEQKDDNDK